MGKIGLEPRTAVCTIVSKNYLHYARTLMDSVRAVHPEWQPYVLLVDEARGDFDPKEESFRCLEVAELPLPEKQKFLFRYTILELNTAVKPWLLEWLFEAEGVDRVVYLDPDICVYRRLREVEEALDNGALMVLTPHLTGELNDGRTPTEQDILKTGCFNLGFVALARHARLATLLHWWQRKLEFDCRVDFAEGLFVDQKWMDLAPGIFDDVRVLRHEGYNVAYWNLAHRRVEKHGDGFLVNGQPLVFFHFSGVNPQAPEAFSKHQDRYRLADLGDEAELVTGYCDAVVANGQAACRHWSYAFGTFADGGKIADVIRTYYRRHPAAKQYAGADPFASDHAYLNEPWGKGRLPLVTHLMRAIWESRRDLQLEFPDIDGFYRYNYALFFLWTLAPEYGLPDRYVEPVRDSLVRLVKPLLLLRVGKQGLRFLRTSLRSVTRRLLPPGSKQWLLDWLKAPHLRPKRPGPAGEPVTGVATRLTRLAARSPLASAEHGLNIIGYIKSEHGLGESARRCAQAAEAAGLPFSVHDFNVGNNSRVTDTSWAHRLANDNRHWINVFHINADQMPLAHATLGQRFLDGHYNIGFWHWELPEFPDQWLPSFDLLDEVWVPTRFVQDAVSRKAPLPVVRMPHAIHCPFDPQAQRSAFGLPADHFLFLTMYDTHSFQVRKNPQAVIEAFRRAFPRPNNVALVVKINNPASYPVEVRALKRALADVPGVLVIDRVLSRQEVYNLEGLCDGFVSLHRSEGFGLGLAESMFLGKPVIGTDWSGNHDFMTPENSCPVRYTLAVLDRDYGPYRRGQVWAEPDLDHAAWYMAKLVADAGWRQVIAAKGRDTIHTEYSPAAVGRLYTARLQILRELHGLATAARLAA